MGKTKKYTEADMLSLIAQGEDAMFFCIDKIPNAKKRFEKLDEALVNYLAFIRKTFPDAEYYTGSGGFNLLLGKPHSDRRGLALGGSQQQLVAFSGEAQIGDGDW